MIKKITYYFLFLVLSLNTTIVIAQEKLENEQVQSVTDGEAIPQKENNRYSKFNSSSRGKVSRIKEVKAKLLEAKKSFKKNPEEALDLVHDGLLIAIKENYLSLEAESYTILGQFNFKLNEYSLSYKNYKKAIAIYKNLEPPTTKVNPRPSADLVNLYYLTGKSAELSSNLDNSLSYYTDYLLNISSNNDIVKVKTSLGDVYLKKGELKYAENFYQQALEIEKRRDNKSGIVTLNLKLGEVEKEKKNTEKAVEYYRNSQDFAIQTNDDQAVNQAYTDISNIYATDNNYDDGVQITQEALEFNTKRNNKSEQSKNNIDLANFLSLQDKDEEAIEHLVSSVLIAEESGDIVNKSKAYKALSEAYEKTGKKSEAVEKYKQYLQLEDSLYKIRKKQLAIQNKKGAMLENAQNKLSLLEKDKQLNENTIELLRQERIIQEEFINKQRILTYSLILGILILLVTSYLVYRSNKAKNTANQLLVLKSLRAQMNPHFIFNALNSVNSFISNSDERAANRYLADFSKLMRDVMENSQEDFISLTKEIDILSMYIKLEHHRFKDKFDYSFDVDPDINTEDFLIPPMLIQPYIENAVWHGLRYKKEKGFLKVEIKKADNAIIVSIEDDGIGRKKSQEIKTDNQKIMQSTGIKNIDSRLKIIDDIYKTKLDVQITDADIVNQSGTKVIVKIVQDNHSKV